ncbi:MAG: hypothetical protein M1840_006957 [Geoglossum simile]|nr:MAG: hypothetical protein M1840_006957 [Geoglossum simile]
MADDCVPQYADRVRQAAVEAMNMADYAAKRAVLNSYPRKGNLFEDMLGATGPDDDALLSQVRLWFVAAGDRMRLPTSPSDGVVIHCSDSFLTLIDKNNGVYRDRTRAGARVQVGPRLGAAENACGGVLQAFEYAYYSSEDSDGGQVIVLCSDSTVGALQAPDATMDSWRTAGNLKEISLVKELGIDFFGRFLSYKILHEMMHAASSTQFPGQLPDKNPDGSAVGELYGYERIAGRKIGQPDAGTAQTVNNRQHNADSYALLACGWYLPSYAYLNGEIKIVKAADRPPAVIE